MSASKAILIAIHWLANAGVCRSNGGRDVETACSNLPSDNGGRVGVLGTSADGPRCLRCELTRPNQVARSCIEEKEEGVIEVKGPECLEI